MPKQDDGLDWMMIAQISLVLSKAVSNHVGQIAERRLQPTEWLAVAASMKGSDAYSQEVKGTDCLNLFSFYEDNANI